MTNERPPSSDISEVPEQSTNQILVDRRPEVAPDNDRTVLSKMSLYNLDRAGEELPAKPSDATQKETVTSQFSEQLTGLEEKDVSTGIPALSDKESGSGIRARTPCPHHSVRLPTNTTDFLVTRSRRSGLMSKKDRSKSSRGITITPQKSDKDGDERSVYTAVSLAGKTTTSNSSDEKELLMPEIHPVYHEKQQQAQGVTISPRDAAGTQAAKPEDKFLTATGRRQRVCEEITSNPNQEEEKKKKPPAEILAVSSHWESVKSGESAQSVKTAEDVTKLEPDVCHCASHEENAAQGMAATPQETPEKKVSFELANKREQPAQGNMVTPRKTDSEFCKCGSHEENAGQGMATTPDKRISLEQASKQEQPAQELILTPKKTESEFCKCSSHDENAGQTMVATPQDTLEKVQGSEQTNKPEQLGLGIILTPNKTDPAALISDSRKRIDEEITRKLQDTPEKKSEPAVLGSSREQERSKQLPISVTPPVRNTPDIQLEAKEGERTPEMLHAFEDKLVSPARGPLEAQQESPVPQPVTPHQEFKEQPPQSTVASAVCPAEEKFQQGVLGTISQSENSAEKPQQGVLGIVSQGENSAMSARANPERSLEKKIGIETPTLSSSLAQLVKQITRTPPPKAEEKVVEPKDASLGSTEKQPAGEITTPKPVPAQETPSDSHSKAQSDQVLSRTSKMEKSKAQSEVSMGRSHQDQQLGGTQTPPEKQSHQPFLISDRQDHQQDSDLVATNSHREKWFKGIDKSEKKGLEQGVSTPRSQRAHDDQEVTTAKAKTPEPKPAEFSLASMFPSLFGRSASTDENTSGSDATASRPPAPVKRTSSFSYPEPPTRPKDPRRDVVRFRSDYANRYALGSRHTVDFFSGSYDDVQREARNSVRLIVVFIHDPSMDESRRFINETLNSLEFGALVNNHNLLVWGVGNDTDEGKYVAYNLHVNKFPFLSIMCPRADNRFFSVRRITGFTTAGDLVSRLEKAIEIVRVDLKDLREQRDKLLEDRRLMQEQEKAYRESAEKDKQKMLEAKKARQEKQEAEEREKRKQKEESDRRKLIADQREMLRQRQQDDQAPTGKDTVHMQVRFPCGTKFSRRFALDDSLEKLFTAILCHESCPDFFTVAAGFPRTQIDCVPEWYYIVLSEQLIAEGLSPTEFKPPITFRAAGFNRPVGAFVNSYGS